jgi:hypothetical protein
MKEMSCAFRAAPVRKRRIQAEIRSLTVAAQPVIFSLFLNDESPLAAPLTQDIGI